MADIAVELILLPTEHGGRRAPIGQGYRPQFYYDNADWDALYEYEIVGVIPHGRLVTARLTFCSQQYHWGKLFVGMPFLMREGNRVVGYGRVMALLDLEASAHKANDGGEPAPPAKRPGDDTSFIVRSPSRRNQQLDVTFASRRAREITFHRQRDVWTELLRQHAEKLRIWCADILQRLCVLIGWSRLAMQIGRCWSASAMAFHHQWEVWRRFLQLVELENRMLRISPQHQRDVRTNSLRRYAEKVRVWSAGFARRLSVVMGWLSLPLLIGWCGIAAVVLLVSLAVHASTFMGIDPVAKWPGVMLIDVAVFPSFIAALIYASRTNGNEGGDKDRVFISAPLWLRILLGVFFVYSFVDFVICSALQEGGVPRERDGKYVLHSHGILIRELSDSEYHRHQAYEVRTFSGGWILFSCGALTLLVGTLRLRRRSTGTPSPALEPRTEEKAKLPPEPTTVRAAVVSLAVYILCVGMIFSGQPGLGAAAVLPITIAMALALRRHRGFPHGDFESYIGRLALIPNVFIALAMGHLVAEFIYLAIYVGFDAAFTHQVALLFPGKGPWQLSNGELLDRRVWVALEFLNFPAFLVGTSGLTYLAEQVGRLIEVRRRGTNAGAQNPSRARSAAE